MPRNIMLYPGLNRDAALPFGALQQAFGCISVCLSNRVNNIDDDKSRAKYSPN